MCRDGFKQECESPGCTEIVRCRDFPRMCPEHDFTSLEDLEEETMQLIHSVSRKAKYSDMTYMGNCEVFVYQGNVVLIPAASMPDDDVYEYKDVSIFIHSNGVVKKNRFGAVTKTDGAIYLDQR